MNARNKLEMPMTNASTTKELQISIIIKALNEEKYIAQSIESALKAIEGLPGEVILADSLSTDKTIEIAKNYPVKIVQLTKPEDKCCGIGAQLGYQYATGKYVYILDGDMELETDFISAAIEIMESRPELGGIAGIVTEYGGGNYEFEARKKQSELWAESGEKEWLDMGGLYRREAVESVGYLTNKFLHAYEEQELGMRLVSKGWKIERQNLPSVKHYGHTVDTASLMLKRWKSKYIDGSGELLRNSIGEPYFNTVVKSNSRLIFMSFVFGGFILSFFAIPFTAVPFAGFLALLFSLYLALVIRKKDFTQALTSFVLWPVRTAGFVRGLLRSPGSPESHIESRVVSSSEH